jgi:hypothetical protein
MVRRVRLLGTIVVASRPLVHHWGREIRCRLPIVFPEGVRRMLHRMRRIIVIAVASLAIAGIAAAAGERPPCHPDLPGTRSLIVAGAVTSYRFAAPGTLVVSVRTGRGAGVARWNYASSPRATAAVSYSGSNATRSAASAEKLAATQGNRIVRVVLAPRGADRPDRLDVLARATGHSIASWPLIVRPVRVALYGGVAILLGPGANPHKGALYALRISDGRIAELAIAPSNDRPIIGPEGVAYQDDQFLNRSRHHLPSNGVALKLVPLASVERQLRLADRQVVTRGPISAISMDGQRVAIAVHDPAGRCDHVKLWIPPWHFSAHVSHASGPTCLPTHAAGGITNVAMAGVRIVWTTTYGQTTRVLAASTIGCNEWVVARARGSAPVAALAGDDNVMAYALRGGTVGLVPGHWQGHVISKSSAQVSGMSVDGNRIAMLHRNGHVAVMTAAGARISSFAAGRAFAVALRGDTVAVLRSGHLAIYNAKTGVLTHSWTVPANSRTVDLVYGIAVVAAGRDVLALNVHTGHTARLLHAGGRVAAQIDSPGAVVQFNAGGRGHVQFIPMSMIEAGTS